MCGWKKQGIGVVFVPAILRGHPWICAWMFHRQSATAEPGLLLVREDG